GVAMTAVLSTQRMPAGAPAALMALGAGLLAGAAIGLLGEFGAAVLIAFGVLLLGTLAAVNSAGRYRDTFLAVVFVAMFAIPLIHKAFGGYFWGLWQLALVGAALFGLRPLFAFAGHTRTFRVALVLFGLYLLAADRKSTRLNSSHVK